MGKKKFRYRITSFKNLVGVLTVLLVAAYFIFMFVQFKNQSKVSFYEVEEGNIVKENSYEGLIIRSETVKYAEASGYVNFYIADGKKAAKNSRVYSLDESGDLKNYLASHSDVLTGITKVKLRTIHDDMIRKSKNFDPVNFSSSYMYLENLESQIIGLTDNNAFNSLSEDIKALGIKFIDCRADHTGLVSYQIDGYESLARGDVKKTDFDKSLYKAERIKSNDLVSSGMPVYKLITDEKWEIVFPMTENDVKEFSEKSSVKVNFKNHGITATADLEMFKSIEGDTYGSLKISKYLVQFLNDRFVDFEIETNNVSGLKIPEKSITTKDYYEIPLSLRKKDSKGNPGVYKVEVGNGSNVYKFIVIDSYYEDDEFCYINLPSDGSLVSGNHIGDPDDQSYTYKIEDVKSLQGAYNINKGYAVFRLIEEQERSNGYCIIKKNTPYGLMLYDHIILDASTVEEGEVLY